VNRVRVAATLFVVTVGACHFDDSFQIDVTVDPERPGPKFREACTEQAAASCAYQERCYGYYFERGWFDRATCVDRTMLACQLLAGDPHASRDEDSIRACALPPDYPCPSDPAFDAARAAFRAKCPETEGTLPNGSKCSTYAACASGTCMKDYAGQLCGTCLPDPCAACTEGQLGAVQVDGTGSCRTLRELGAPCIEHYDCASSYCKDSLCSPRADEGEPCDPGAPSCVASLQVGLFCSDVTLRCERVELLKAGESCEDWWSGAVECGDGTSCLHHGGTATCVAPAADGTPCFTGQGLACLAPASCIDGFCRFQSPLSCSPS
jgi:hypothetical protein